MLTQKTYATVQLGLTAWQVIDKLGPPNVRQKFSLAAGVKELYHFHVADEESAWQDPSERATGAAEYKEIFWQSNRVVNGTYQHIAVLLKDGEVSARRHVGID